MWRLETIGKTAGTGGWAERWLLKTLEQEIKYPEIRKLQPWINVEKIFKK